MNADDQIRHTSDCARGNVTQGRGAEGDIVQRCRDCGRIAILDDDGQRVDRMRNSRAGHITGPVNFAALAATAKRLGVPAWRWDDHHGRMVQIA
ncbi:hypothetical protein PROP_03138 [Propionicimonas sp. T2.31MG-18]|uniref:hypothetical protein n=1 Tax=Propionicimonas sp. T2.31MG-18 TaxID=3157620 RepID=UPI0035EC0B58